MAPADTLSPAGSSSYASDTMVVGDGTWDFTKNTFLLPNLVGLNFATMQYNGMGNRFSTIPEYHSLVKGHGVLAAITFLFIIPIAVMIARFYNRRPGYAVRYHAYLQVIAVGLTTVIFILGYFAVGPKRSLTNPHHGIGVAIYVLILLQAIGGRFVKHLAGRRRSFRLMIHKWNGRAVALLGIVQVPLGLTLYGSPKFTFILYALWMAFLLFLYFILSWRHDGEGRDVYISGARSEGRGRSPDGGKSGRSGFGWLAPLAAGAGAWALLRGRRKERERSVSRTRDRSRTRSRSRAPEVISSRRGSDSYVDEEKFSERRPRRASGGGGGGFMDKVLAGAAALGAGALISNFVGRRKDRRRDEEYSAVDTDTPSRHSRLHRPPPRRHGAAASELSADTDDTYSRRSPLLPGPGNPAAAAAALSTVQSTRPTTSRPRTPRPSHRRAQSSRLDSVDESDYSSYRSPSRRTPAKSNDAAAKGLLAGLGLGWFAKRMQDRRNKKEEERLRAEEEERRAGERDRRDGRSDSRYTGDGYPSPSRRDSRRRPPPTRHRPAPSETIGSASDFTESVVETRPPTSAFSGPPMPPLTAPGAPVTPGPPMYPGAPGVAPAPYMPAPVTPAPMPSRSRSRSRHDFTDPAAMPAMPTDPHGVLHHESNSESYVSSDGPPQRGSSRRRREGEAAAAVAAATASRLAAEEDDRRRAESRDNTPSTKPVSVKLKLHDDRDRNVTLRRLTEEEAAAARGGQRRRRSDSASSLSGTETPGSRRYRRDSSQRRAERSAERRVEELPASPPPLAPSAPLSPPNPPFAGGRRPKDSAYYSGQPGPSGAMPAAGHTVSSIGSPDSHGTWSGVSPSPSGPLHDQTASAAERRRRRRLERRDTSRRPSGTVEFS